MQTFIIRVERDDAYIEALEALVTQAVEAIQTNVETCKL
jgi:hypothetical protein